jgi:hypothetical protein
LFAFAAKAQTCVAHPHIRSATCKFLVMQGGANFTRPPAGGNALSMTREEE